MLEKREKWGNSKSEAEGKMMEKKNYRKKILNLTGKNLRKSRKS